MTDTLKAVIGIWSEEYIYSSKNSAQFTIKGQLVTVFNYGTGLKFVWRLTTLTCSKDEIIDTCRLIYAGLSHIAKQKA